MGVPRIPFFRILFLLAAVIAVINFACGQEKKFGATENPVYPSAYPTCINLEAGSDATPGPGACGPVMGILPAANLGPIPLGDGSLVTGTLPQVNGGTSEAVGCGAPSATCGPCTLPGVQAYWSADVGVVLGDSGTTVVTWTDVCNGYVVSNAVNANQPTYTANCLGTGAVSRHCIASTGGAATVLAAIGGTSAPNFPIIVPPMAIGFTGFGTGSAPGSIEYVVDMGPALGEVSLVRSTSGPLNCVWGSSTVAPASAINSTRLASYMCLLSKSFASGSVGQLGMDAINGGIWGGNTTGVGTGLPDGGIAIGGPFDGGSLAAGADIFSVTVWNTVPTKLSLDAHRAFEQTYYGGAM
jgi:hypothetical protein